VPFFSNFPEFFPHIGKNTYPAAEYHLVTPKKNTQKQRVASAYFLPHMDNNLHNQYVIEIR
jgi:hypothetical protein